MPLILGNWNPDPPFPSPRHTGSVLLHQSLPCSRNVLVIGSSGNRATAARPHLHLLLSPALAAAVAGWSRDLLGRVGLCIARWRLSDF